MAVSSHMRGYSARRMARGDTVRTLGRIGFLARGTVYLIIGWITLLIAFQHKALEADRTGALELIASKPLGSVLLWVLVIGFGGMALWRLSMAAYPPAGKRGAGSRVSSLFRAVLYGIACVSTLSFVLTHHASGSTNKASQDFTASAMKHPGGPALVALVGVAIIIGGLALAWRGVKRSFAKDLKTSEMNAAERRWVLRLGMIGNIARGIVFAAVGGFMLDAAVTFDPAQAKGVDATIRSFAAASYGPVLLVLMALGLAAFGLYSWAEARWRRL